MNSKKPIETTNEIVIRPRFKLELAKPKETILNAFETSSKSLKEFIVSRIDDHVFIKYPKNKQSFWSPQLHLEVNETNQDNAIVYGLFGPNPTLWLLFMFMHLILAIVAIGFAIWLYTNWSLGNSFMVQAIVLGVILCLWILLYIFGRLGRASVKEEMQELQSFMEAVLKTVNG